MDLDPILCCPRCKLRLAKRIEPAPAYLCARCRRQYPVVEGIAAFIAAEALPVHDRDDPKDNDKDEGNEKDDDPRLAR